MREYERIETPTDFPAMCICGSQKAPLVDTHLVKDAYGHVYICLQCTKRLARALGIAKGAEMDRLEHAAEELVQAEREIADGRGCRRTPLRAGQAEGKIVTLQAHRDTAGRLPCTRAPGSRCSGRRGNGWRRPDALAGSSGAIFYIKFGAGLARHQVMPGWVRQGVRSRRHSRRKGRDDDGRLDRGEVPDPGRTRGST